MSILFTRARLAKVATFTSAQMAVQAIGFASGIVLVRCMASSEYGFYTLALGMIGLANVLLDLGLSTAVLSSGGRMHRDVRRLGALVGDAWRWQARSAALGGVVLVPAFAAMLVWQSLPATRVAMLSLMATACGVLTVRSAIAQSVVRLRGDIALQQRLEIGVNAGKLLAVAVAALVFIDAEVAIALNLAAAAAMSWLLRRYLVARLGDGIRATGEHARSFAAFVRKQAPNSIYYCLSGQLTVFLVGLFGTADRVGELGALGRLSVFFTIIGAVVTAFAQPYFARADSRREVINAFVGLNACFGLLTAGLVGVALTHPGVLLWILGPRYAGLSVEVAWMVLAASLSAWSAAIFLVGAAREWVVPAALNIPLGIATLALSAWLFDLSTVAGGFMMSSSVAATYLLVALGYVATRMLESKDRVGVTA